MRRDKACPVSSPIVTFNGSVATNQTGRRKLTSPNIAIIIGLIVALMLQNISRGLNAAVQRVKAIFYQ